MRRDLDGSNDRRTVKMLLAGKGFSDGVQHPLDVLRGEPGQPEHLERRPFGEVAVLDHDGARIARTSAIADLSLAPIAPLAARAGPWRCPAGAEPLAFL